MKPTSITLYTLFIFFFICFVLNGQTTFSGKISNQDTQELPPETCGSNIVHERLMKSDPVYKERFFKSRQNINKISKQKLSSNTVYKIPVVVHVMHVGESIGVGSNMSHDDVLKGLQILNNTFRKLQGTNGFGEGVDMRIEFVLAIQDENGQSTNGINRVDMSFESDYVTNGVFLGTQGLVEYNADPAINSLKEYAGWDTSKYYNIWLVNKIDGKNCNSNGIKTIGYAYYANAHGHPLDGAVMQSCAFANSNSYISAHELGHGFNLPHTFDEDYDSDTDTYSCPTGDNDGIDDTPSHINSLANSSVYRNCGNADVNSCDPSFNQVINPDTGFTRNSGTHQDHIHNYMDYTRCASEFTGGQRAVAQNALLNIRTSFLTSPALEATASPVVAFSAPSTSTCIGNTVKFTDESGNVPKSFTNEGFNNVSFNWTFDNGVDSPYTSTLQNPTVSFNNMGVYDITLDITNSKGTSSYTLENGMTVNQSPISACNLSSNRKNNNYDFGVRSVTYNTLNNQTSGYIPSNALEDYTCTIFTTIPQNSSNNLEVSYESVDGAKQYLEVWIDWDNSGSFDVLNSNNINELVLSDNVSETNPGTHQATTLLDTPIDVIPNEVLRMRVVSSYLDPVNKCGNTRGQRADDYSVIVTSSLSDQEFQENKNVKLFPNPTTDILNISMKTSSLEITYNIFDIRGQNVLRLKSYEKQLDVSHLTSGLYIIQVQTNDSVFTGKFLKI